jgi:hypothetical protein
LLHAACCHEWAFSTLHGASGGPLLRLLVPGVLSLLLPLHLVDRSSLVRCFWPLDGFSKIGEEVFKTTNRTLVALDLARPTMSGCVFSQLPFDSAATTQAWGIGRCGYKLGAGQIQITLTWTFLWEAQTPPQLEFCLEVMVF